MQPNKIIVKDKDGNQVTQVFNVPEMLQRPPSETVTPVQQPQVGDQSWYQEAKAYQEANPAPPPAPATAPPTYTPPPMQESKVKDMSWYQQASAFQEPNQEGLIIDHRTGQLQDLRSPEQKIAHAKKVAEGHAANGDVQQALKHVPEIQAAEKQREVIEQRRDTQKGNIEATHNERIQQINTAVEQGFLTPEQGAEQIAATKTELESRINTVESINPAPPVPVSDVEATATKDAIIEATSDETSVKESQQIEQIPNEDQQQQGKKVADENPGFFEKVVDSLGTAFNNLLDEGALAEAAIMYLGSRAMGFSHGGSLNWTAGNYLNKVMSDRAEIKKLHMDGKHTEASIEAYKESKDAKDLELIKVSGFSIDRTKPSMGQIIGTTKTVKVYPGEDKNGNKIFVDGQGRPIDTDKIETDPYKVKGSKEYNQRLSDTSRQAATQFQSLQKQFGTYGEGEEKGTFTDLNPETAASQVGRWATENGIDPNEMGIIAAQAYEEMRNFAMSAGKRPKDIRPFLNQQIIRNRTGAAELFESKGSTPDSPKWVDADKLATVNRKIGDILKSQGTRGNVSDISNLYYTKKISEWTNTLTQEQRDVYSSAANENESGFYLFIVDKLGIDKRLQK